MKLRLFFCCLFSFYGLTVWASSLSLVVGLGKPPYVIQESNSGFELELIERVVGTMGYKANFVYVPYARAARMLDSEKIDGVLTVNKNLFAKKSLITAPYITYQNVVITKKQSGDSITRIEQLKRYSIAAFQNADVLLGDEFYQASQAAFYYVEIPDQSRQIKLIVEDRVDALVMDVNIFASLIKRYDGVSVEDFDFHFIFPPSFYSMMFNDINMVASFNDAYLAFTKTPEYVALMKKYDISIADLHLKLAL